MSQSVAFRTAAEAFGSVRANDPVASGPSETANGNVVKFLDRTSIAAAVTPHVETQEDVTMARAAARALARAVPEYAVAAIFAEHGELTDKMFDCGELTRRDRARLAYLRWQLERIEDARIGDNLDTLERLTELHETIAAEVAAFVEHVKQARTPRSKKR